MSQRNRATQFCRTPFVFHVIAKDDNIELLQRAAMLYAVLAIALLSARHSHAGIVSKRMNLRWCRLHWLPSELALKRSGHSPLVSGCQHAPQQCCRRCPSSGSVITIFGIRKLECLLSGAQCTNVTDRQTDRQSNRTTELYIFIFIHHVVCIVCNKFIKPFSNQNAR